MRRWGLTNPSPSSRRQPRSCHKTGQIQPLANTCPNFLSASSPACSPPAICISATISARFVKFVELQKNHDCLYCVVDLHAITVPQDPLALKANTREIAAAFIACGIDPKKNIVFNQSQVPEHAELAWVLNCIARIGWLNRMTQFKDKAGKDRENASVGLLDYPVLMAADILIYRATHVPVGDDQKQHLELARDIAQKFNNDFSKSILRNGFGEAFFPLPEPLISGPATRVMSLRDGTKKMSKSDASDYSRINLSDDADQIAQKVRKAKTDPEPLPSEEKGLEGRAGGRQSRRHFRRARGAREGGCARRIRRRQFLDLQKRAGRSRRREALADHRGNAPHPARTRAISTACCATAPSARRVIARENMNAVKDIVGFLR